MFSVPQTERFPPRAQSVAFVAAKGDFAYFFMYRMAHAEFRKRIRIFCNALLFRKLTAFSILL